MDKEDLSSIQEWMAKKDAWFAEQSGERVPVGAGWGELYTEDLGPLHLPSGEVSVSDGFVAFGEGPPVTTVLPGSYPVLATMVDVSPERDRSNSLTAYLTLMLDPAPEVRRESPDELGVGVDSGTVAFVDVQAAETWQQEFPDGREDWIDMLYDTTRPERGLNVALDLQDGSNAVIVQSGYGDGVYPVILGYDAAENLVRIHVDFGIVGGFPDNHISEDRRMTPGRKIQYLTTLISGFLLILGIGSWLDLSVTLVVVAAFVWALTIYLATDLWRS